MENSRSKLLVVAGHFDKKINPYMIAIMTPDVLCYPARLMSVLETIKHFTPYCSSPLTANYRAKIYDKQDLPRAHLSSPDASRVLVGLGLPLFA